MTDGGICDSCGLIVDTLIPIRVLQEINNGYEMQLKHYCPRCFWDRTEEWEYDDNMGGEEDDKDK